MNKRNTIQRSLVLEMVRALKRHVTADEVYDAIVRTHSDISRATVYRNLNLLSEMGEIRRLEMPNGAVRYDHICCEHYHVKCVKCSQIFDVEMAFMDDLEQNISDRHGFTFTGHDIIFRGICPECNK